MSSGVVWCCVVVFSSFSSSLDDSQLELESWTWARLSLSSSLPRAHQPATHTPSLSYLR